MNHVWIITVLIIFSAVAALFVGAVPVTPVDLLHDSGGELTTIVNEIRLPRIILALVTGASLALAGAGMQGLLRNPLAEPGILGVSSGAALFAVVVLYFGLIGWSSWLLPAAAICGSLFSLLIVMLISGARATVTTLILAGVAVGAFFSGLIALALSLAPNPFAAQELSLWLMGSVANRDMHQVSLVLPFLLVGAILVLRAGRYLQALTLGEDTALSLGFPVLKERVLLLLGVALLVGASVAVTGVIGFAGLIVPHIMRFYVKNDPGRLLVSSALAGALLMLWMDLIAQIIPTTTEIRVGVMFTLLGGPFFLYLLLRKKRQWEIAQ